MRRPSILFLLIVLFVIGVLCGRAIRIRGTLLSGHAPQTANGGNAGLKLPASSDGALSPGEPIARLKRLASITNEFNRTRAVSEIADGLDEAQIREALAELERTHVREREQIISRLLHRWAKLNPRAAIDYVMSIKPANERGIALEAAIQGWTEVDLAAARDWTLALREPLRQRALRGLIVGLAENDPKEAIAMISQVHREWYGSLAETIFDQWTARDPREAAAQAARLSKGDFQSEALNIVAERWASMDVNGAREWAEQLWEQKISRLGFEIGTGLTIPARHDAITTVLQAWLEQDPGSAIQWIQQLPDDNKRVDFMATLFSVEGDRDPEQAARLITENLPPGDLRNKLLKDLSFRWSLSDTTGMFAGIARINDPEVQKLLLPEMVQSMLPEDAKAAIALAQSVGGPKKERTISSALAGWSMADSVAAAAWVAQQPANARYYFSIASQWVRRDAEAATAWVGQLPAGAAKDRFLSQVAVNMRMDYMEPSLATRWVEQISDAKLREEAYINIAKTWLSRETESARAWIETAPLSQPLKDELLKPHAE
jgi:hypothetical protein